MKILCMAKISLRFAVIDKYTNDNLKVQVPS